MKKRILTALATLLALASLAACSEQSIPGGGGGNPGDSGYSGNEPNSLPTKKVVFEDIEVTSDNAANSIRLFDMMSKDEENSMFSPLSLNMVLGMLSEGAGGSSKTALDAYLGTDNYSDFAADYMRVVEENYNSQKNASSYYKNVFEIANSFWASNALPFNENYKKNVSEKFGAQIENVDFGDKKNTLKKINGWVNEKTHKMIPTILDDYDNDTAAVLVNTVYFESGWVDEWGYYEDMTEPFTLLDGSTKDIALMRNGGDSYFENDKATAFGSRYRNGLEFIGILPKQTGDFTLEELDIPSLLESESYAYDVLARMPKLNFESNFPLTEALKAVGLSEIFDPNTADFTAMQGSDDELFFISEVLQKTKLELDENGTKAAAVTAAIIADLCAEMPEEREKKEVFLNRPFAFLIYDSARDQIVFLGKVTNP